MKKLIIILIIFSSCTAKKTVIEYKERIVKDTVNIEVLKTVIKPIKETFIVEQPCDSLGMLKTFEKTFKTQKATVTLKNVNGNINLKVDIDSIVDLKIKEFKGNYKQKTEIKEVEVIRYKTNFTIILILVLSILINVLLIKSKF